MRGDASLLRDVLQNLLDNAIQYTPPGGHIRVSAAAASRESVITVADTGIGIPLADQERIFERFYRVDAARSREAAAPASAFPSQSTSSRPTADACGWKAKSATARGFPSRFRSPAEAAFPIFVSKYSQSIQLTCNISLSSCSGYKKNRSTSAHPSAPREEPLSWQRQRPTRKESFRMCS